MNKIKQSASLGAIMSIICVWFTSQFGSGWATGMNTLVYFSSHGWPALVTPFLGMGICAYVSWVTIEYARLSGAYQYRAFMESLYQHKAFGIAFDIIQVFGMFITVGALSSGFASALTDYMGISYGIGILLFCILMIAGVTFGEKMVRTSGSILGIAIIVCLCILFVACAVTKHDAVSQIVADRVVYTSWGSALWSTVKFAMLTAGMCVTLLPIMRPLKTRKDTVTVAVGGFVLNVLYILILNYIVLAFMPEAASSNVPILYAVREIGSNVLTVVYVVVLVLAIVTTGIGCLFSYVARYMDLGVVKKMSLRPSIKSLIILVIILAGSSAVSSVGLYAIIAKGYSYMSYLNTPLVCAGIPLWGTWRLYKIYKKKGAEKGKEE